MKNDKPREFWIRPESATQAVDDGWEHYVQIANRNMWDVPVLHVIEKSAYDQLEAENKRLKEINGGSFTYKCLMAANKERDEAEALIEKLNAITKNIELDFIGEQYQVLETDGFDSRVELAKIVREIRR